MNKVRSRSGIIVAAVIIVGIAVIVAAAIVIPTAIIAGVAWRAAEEAAIVGVVAGIVIAVAIAVAAVVVFGKAVAEDGAAGICAGEVGSGITAAAAAAAGSQTEHGRAGQSNEFQVLSFHGTNS